MATREEIRGGIARLCAKGMRDCDYECASCKELNRVLKDVVIKVDRELPKLPHGDGICPICGGNLVGVASCWGEGGGLYCEGNCNCYVDTEKYRGLFISKAGYVATEPLVEE